MHRKSLTLLAALVGVSLFLSGCVAVVVAGVAGGVGGYAWSNGKLSFTTPHDVKACHDATIPALAELGVDVTSDTTGMLAGRIKGLTAAGEDVKIDLEPQSIRVTKVDIRVGFWGNKTRSQMIADAIKKNLP